MLKNLLRFAKNKLSQGCPLNKTDIQNALGLLSTGPVQSHPKMGSFRKGDLTVVEIEKEVKVEIFTYKGHDEGYHNYSNSWWYNLNCPLSFSYIDIDSLYPKQYFSQDSTGHPDKAFAKDIYEYMQKTYFTLFGRNFESVLELGTGGGEITYQFQANNLDFIAVEGTEEGCTHLKNIGIPAERIVKTNLKKMPSLNRKFDIVMCTEVIEHVEPFFAGKLVESCVDHSDVVWFSGADRRRPAHYHHVNEIAIEAWDNIFAYLGHNQHVELNKLHFRADRVYLKNFLK